MENETMVNFDFLKKSPEALLRGFFRHEKMFVRYSFTNFKVLRAPVDLTVTK